MVISVIQLTGHVTGHITSFVHSFMYRTLRKFPSSFFTGSHVVLSWRWVYIGYWESDRC